MAPSSASIRRTVAKNIDADGYAEWSPGLLVGGLNSAEAVERVRCADGAPVKHLVTFAARLAPELEGKVPDGVRHTVVEIDDHPMADLLATLPAGLAALDRAASSGEGCLVHCASGVSRSVGLCAAWLMTRRGKSFEEALRSLRAVRELANPNAGFQVALRCLEESRGDLDGAHAKWKGKTGADFLSKVRQLRERANEFHFLSDGLEERLARGERTEALGGDLRSLRDKIDEEREELGIDRVARTVVRAASQKVARLLETLTSQKGVLYE